jgi:hypothetical protein
VATSVSQISYGAQNSANRRIASVTELDKKP